MSDTAPPFLDLESEVKDLFAKKLREFAAFCAENWTMTADEAQTLTVPVTNPEQWARGYNAAMTDGLTGAMEHWINDSEGWY